MGALALIVLGGMVVHLMVQTALEAAIQHLKRLARVE